MEYFFGAALLFVFASCAYIPPSIIDHAYPYTGSSNDASIVAKDYETLGIIFVQSTEVIDANGNHTGSKITYEMLMKEAQKLGADDLINLRIDVNEKEDFSDDGRPIRTTFEYTASALAIKYTTAVITGGNTSNSTNQTENSSAEETLVSSSYERPANILNNWISAELAYGGGLRYERMLNSQWSLGADVYFQVSGLSTLIYTLRDEFSLRDEFEIDATTRFYPWAKRFYIGLGLGVHGYSYGYYDYNGYDRYGYTVGFAITPGLGWKIDIGNPGGFFLDLGIKVPVTYGGYYGIAVSPIPNVGLGWAF